MTSTGGAVAGTDPGDLAAARLLRWYPAAWRARYGEEFTELLLAEFAEQPRSRRRTADVILSGLLARLAGLGLTGFGLGAADQARASLATLGAAAAAFLTFGLAMLAQLAIGWQWAMPRDPATTSGLALMAGATTLLLLLALLAAVPVAWATAAALRGRGPGRLPRRRLHQAGRVRAGRRDRAGGRRAPLPELLARHRRHRRAPRPGARRGGRVELGLDAVGLVLTGPTRPRSARSPRRSWRGWL